MFEQRAAPGTSISQTDRVILALREMLLRGDFAKGERLAELTLVRRLDASRNARSFGAGPTASSPRCVKCSRRAGQEPVSSSAGACLIRMPVAGR